jgi:hypothetical protein
MLYTMYISFFAKIFGYSAEYPCINTEPAPLLKKGQRLYQYEVILQWLINSLFLFLSN